jgi:hypothetical protein
MIKNFGKDSICRYLLSPLSLQALPLKGEKFSSFWFNFSENQRLPSPMGRCLKGGGVSGNNQTPIQQTTIPVRIS